MGKCAHFRDVLHTFFYFAHIYTWINISPHYVIHTIPNSLRVLCIFLLQLEKWKSIVKIAKYHDWKCPHWSPPEIWETCRWFKSPVSNPKDQLWLNRFKLFLWATDIKQFYPSLLSLPSFLLIPSYLLPCPTCSGSYSWGPFWCLIYWSWDHLMQDITFTPHSELILQVDVFPGTVDFSWMHLLHQFF